VHKVKKESRVVISLP